MMDDFSARRIAEDFIKQQKSQFEYRYIGVVRASRRPNEINVNFDVSGPDGNLFDGPVVVIVDEIKETARFFESA